MEKVTSTLFNWASLLDDKARDQAVQTASMPFVFPHVALMPDAHWGLGATVGSVIPTRRAIIPAAVGVDIGCGMNAVRTQFTVDQFHDRGRPLATLREAIERAIPLGAGNNNTTVSATAEPRVEALQRQADQQTITPGLFAKNWELQLGSLGAGNHFIEVSHDEDGVVWLFLHSGSRGVGNKIATHFIKKARQLCEQWWIRLPAPDLAYLAEHATNEFWGYITHMRWAQNFALANREEMMDRLVACVSEWMGQDVERVQAIACHHNYTEQEEHFGQRVWLSRKGAINAAEGVLGLIPGSMGTASYVVRGKGNRLALNSAPHGAGRAHSRGQARKMFTGAQLAEAMSGVEYRHTDAFLDEHPLAYKDIDVVMKDADDLVEVLHTLRQFVNVKGD